MVKELTSPNSRTHPKKPRWQTVLSVFTKNYVLLQVLLLLAEMIFRLVLGNKDVYSLGFDGRIDEVVKYLLQTTTKMMQVEVEVEVVDRKIEKEIEDLRNELCERINENDVIFGAKLRDLDGRVESVEGSLISGEWIGKDEFNKFLEEFKFKKGKDKGFDGDMKLDEMKAFVKEIIEKEMEKHDADGLGRIDYAVAAGGGMVVKHSEPYSMGNNSWSMQDGIHADAQKILQPSFGEPGQCFPLKGNSGYVQIRLRKAIIPEAITLEHVAKSMAYDRSTAPKDCIVFGWLHKLEYHNLKVDAEKMLLLTEFSYDLEKSDVQTFNVLERAEAYPYALDTIRLTSHQTMETLPILVYIA